MVSITIQGIKDGQYEIDIEADVREVEGMFPEFIGNLTVKGKLIKLGSRFSVIAEVMCTARLVCDLSLQEFDEPVKAELKSSYLANTDLWRMRISDEYADNEERLISEDSKVIDITNEIREQLAVNLPMKRIAPELSGKSFEEIHPELTDKKSEKIRRRVIMIHVIASVRVKPGNREELLNLFKANLTKVREENGCIRYFLAIDVVTGLPPQ